MDPGCGGGRQGFILPARHDLSEAGLLIGVSPPEGSGGSRGCSPGSLLPRLVVHLAIRSGASVRLLDPPHRLPIGNQSIPPVSSAGASNRSPRWPEIKGAGRPGTIGRESRYLSPAGMCPGNHGRGGSIHVPPSSYGGNVDSRHCGDR